MLAEESVIGDWADEDGDFGQNFDDGSTFLGHAQGSSAAEATVDYTYNSVTTESPPSLYGTEASSPPSTDEAAQGSSPTFIGAVGPVGPDSELHKRERGAAPSLRLAVAR